jgi:hypothetical protein
MKRFDLKIVGFFLMMVLFGCGDGGGSTPSTTGTSTPPVIAGTATSTRYVMFHVKNDGSLGHGSYAELRSVKLFGTASTNNLLNGTSTGGTAHVESVAGLDGAIPYQTPSQLGTTCSENWYPMGTLCDESPNTHDPNISQKTISHSGATWGSLSSAAGGGTGVIVIDMGQVNFFNRLSVFQMFSDGKTTQIKMFRHLETSDTAPLHTDANWVQVFDYMAVPAGTSSGDNLTVTNPLIVNIP